eukprot:m.156649 g.156649  ORF g.156649 m.156649 type:complete len:595 (+) comp31012_c0_seq1:1-1785(+)
MTMMMMMSDEKKHPLTWTVDDTAHWCMTSAPIFTPVAGKIDGTSVWNFEESHLLDLLPQSDRASAAILLNELKHRSCMDDFELAAHLQCESIEFDPCSDSHLTATEYFIGDSCDGGDTPDAHHLTADYAYVSLIRQVDMYRGLTSKDDAEFAQQLQQDLSASYKSSLQNIEADMQFASQVQVAYETVPSQVVNAHIEHMQQILRIDPRLLLVLKATLDEHSPWHLLQGETTILYRIWFYTKGTTQPQESISPEPEQGVSPLVTDTNVASSISEAMNNMDLSGAAATFVPLPAVAREVLTCATCMEASEDTTALPCGHNICKFDLQELVKVSLTDASLLPLKCCKQGIPCSLISSTVSPLMASKYAERCMDVSPVERMYCQNPVCSAFINLEPFAGTGLREIECPTCGKDLCIQCKTRAHPHVTCETWAATNEAERDATLFDLAKQEGWATCFNCNTLVELHFGCNHMTCRCKAEFCYQCGCKWKTCGCDAFVEQNLLLTENRDLQLEEGRLGRPLEEVEVERVREAVRVRVDRHIQFEADTEECEHEDRYLHEYSSTKGSRRCDNCDHPTPSYAYKCTEGCHARFCKVCHFHRL